MENLSNEDSILNLWTILYKCTHFILKAREKELRVLDITPEQASVLYILHVVGGRSTRSEIAKYTCREIATISGLIKNLEKKRLVRLEENRNDKRTKYVIITEDGATKYEATAIRGSLHSIFDDLTTSEREILETIVKKLYKKATAVLTDMYKPTYLR